MLNLLMNVYYVFVIILILVAIGFLLGLGALGIKLFIRSWRKI